MKTLTKFIFSFIFILFSTQSLANINGNGVIFHVVDGDTFDIKTSRENLHNLIIGDIVSKEHVDFSKSIFRVRLANIDTAESNHYDESKNTKEGVSSKEYVKKVFLNNSVDFTCFKKGYYGRAICSINDKFVGDIGLHLIKNNHSKYITQYGKHPTMHKQYLIEDKKNLLSKENFNEIKNKALNLTTKLF